MIDVVTAKQLVIEDWLPAYEEDLETSAMLIEDLIEEYEWGWVFHRKPVDPTKVPSDEAKWGNLPILVDRTNGHIVQVGTACLKVAVAKLLLSRESGDE